MVDPDPIQLVSSQEEEIGAQTQTEGRPHEDAVEVTQSVVISYGSPSKLIQLCWWFPHTVYCSAGGERSRATLQQSDSA